MIIDTIDNLKKYVGINPLFADVVEFIKNNDLNTLEAGKHFIKDKDLFVNIQMAKGRTPDAATLETHINMIDIQIPLDGEETFGYTPLEDLQGRIQRREGHHEVRGHGTELRHLPPGHDGHLLPTRRSRTLHLAKSRD